MLVMKPTLCRPPRSSLAQNGSKYAVCAQMPMHASLRDIFRDALMRPLALKDGYRDVHNFDWQTALLVHACVPCRPRARRSWKWESTLHEPRHALLVSHDVLRQRALHECDIEALICVDVLCRDARVDNELLAASSIALSRCIECRTWPSNSCAP